MDTVYIETSIVSHATAWPSKNPAIAALQVQAKQWLEFEAPKIRLVTSQFVIDEVSRGENRNRLHDASESSIRRVACCLCRACRGRISVDAKLSPHRERNRASSTLSFTGRSATAANFGLYTYSVFGRP